MNKTKCDMCGKVLYITGGCTCVQTQSNTGCTYGYCDNCKNYENGIITTGGFLCQTCNSVTPYGRKQKTTGEKNE